MGKLKHTFNAFPDLQTKFFSQTMRHLVIFYKVSMISITICTFYKFQVDSAIINNEQKKLQQEVTPTKLFQIHQDKFQS